MIRVKAYLRLLRSFLTKARLVLIAGIVVCFLVAAAPHIEDISILFSILIMGLGSGLLIILFALPVSDNIQRHREIQPTVNNSESRFHLLTQKVRSVTEQVQTHADSLSISADLWAGVSALTQRVRDLEAGSDETQTEMPSLSTQLKNSAFQAEQIQSELLVLKSSLENAINELSSLQSDVGELQNNLPEIKFDIESLKSAYPEIHRFREDVAVLKAELNTSKASSEKLSDYQRRIENQLTHINPALDKFKGLTERLQALEEAARSINSEIQKFDGKQIRKGNQNRRLKLAQDSVVLMDNIITELADLTGPKPVMEERITLLNDSFYAVSANVSELLTLARDEEIESEPEITAAANCESASQ